MPAVRDVGVRFVAPACRHTVRWAMCRNCCREPRPPGLSPHPPRAVVINAGWALGVCGRGMIHGNTGGGKASSLWQKLAPSESACGKTKFALWRHVSTAGERRAETTADDRSVRAALGVSALWPMKCSIASDLASCRDTSLGRSGRPIPRGWLRLRETARPRCSYWRAP